MAVALFAADALPVHAPQQPLDALIIAQLSVAAVPTAIAWSRPSRPPLSPCLLVRLDLVGRPPAHRAAGVQSFDVHPAPDHRAWAFDGVALLAAAGALFSGRLLTLLIAIADSWCFARPR